MSWPASACPPKTSRTTPESWANSKNISSPKETPSSSVHALINEVNTLEKAWKPSSRLSTNWQSTATTAILKRTSSVIVSSLDSGTRGCQKNSSCRTASRWRKPSRRHANWKPSRDNRPRFATPSPRQSANPPQWTRSEHAGDQRTPRNKTKQQHAQASDPHSAIAPTQPSTRLACLATGVVTSHTIAAAAQPRTSPAARARRRGTSPKSASPPALVQRNAWARSSTTRHPTSFHNEATAWHRCVYVYGTPITMKVDTGADVTAISESAFNSALHRTPQLTTSRRILKGPDGRPLDVVGCFNTALSIHYASDRSSRHTVYVVRGLHSPLLGRPAITALRVLSEIAAVGTLCHSVSYVTDKFPTLFKGLGELKGSPYTIRLGENATPFSLSTPRRVPLPLQPAVDAELQRMVDTGVIRSVDQPTDWCSGMVAVPNPDGRVRVCTDFTRLNQSVRRERHMLPSIEHLLADVQGATYFSKLDANSGFHQVPLDSESQLLTTFITPSGRYCYNRLPFSISSAPEHFQTRMASLLNGCKGVICMMDDILIFGSTPEEHNERLDAILDRLATAGITLNRAKFVFRQTRVRFCGYILDATGISADPSKVSALVNMPPCENVSDVRRFLGMANQ